MSAILNLGDKITAGNRADATFFYKKRVLADSGTLLTEAETDANNRELLAQSLFDKASIVYTAGGVKAGKAYSVKGTDFGVTRAGVKNVVNRAGLLTEIPANTPATEFAGGVLKGTLIEPARTNLLLRSEEFDNVAWTRTNISGVTANITTAPDGTMTADKIVANTTVGGHYISQAPTAGTNITAQCYLKSGEYTSAYFQILDGTINLYVYFNLETGATITNNFGGGSPVVSVVVEQANDGWKNFKVRVSSIGTLSANGFRIGPASSFAVGGHNFAGNNVNGIFLWGAQLETGSVATSYIKTVDTAITQPADVITATGVSGLANGQGTVLIAFTPLNLPATTYHRLFAVDNGTSSDNGYDIGYGDAGGALARTTFRIGGATSFDSTAGAVTIGQRQIVAFAFANNDFQVALNGTLQGASASGSTNIQHSRIIIGGRSDGTGNNAIEEVYYFPTRLTNAELETLTTL
jgi:hypothetical protein